MHICKALLVLGLVLYCCSKLRPVSFLSREMLPAEHNYVPEQELPNVIEACGDYLGSNCNIATDNKANTLLDAHRTVSTGKLIERKEY